ncbi:unnamed protein product [Sphagnum troendelagicum]
MALVCPNQPRETLGHVVVLPGSAMISRLGLCAAHADHHVNTASSDHPAAHELAASGDQQLQQFCMAEDSSTTVSSGSTSCHNYSAASAAAPTSCAGGATGPTSAGGIWSSFSSSALARSSSFVPSASAAASTSSYGDWSSMPQFPHQSAADRTPSAPVPGAFNLGIAAGHASARTPSTSYLQWSSPFSSVPALAASHDQTGNRLFYPNSNAAAQPRPDVVAIRSTTGSLASCDTSSWGELQLSSVAEAAGSSASASQQQRFLGVAAPAAANQYEILPSRASGGFSSYHAAAGQRVVETRAARQEEDDMQQVQDAEVDTVSAWVDGRIGELMAAMPGVPLQHLFAKLLEVLEPCNTQLEKVIAARFHALSSSAAGSPHEAAAAGSKIQKQSQAHVAGSNKRMRENTNDDLHAREERDNQVLQLQRDQPRLAGRAVTATATSSHPLQSRNPPSRRGNQLTAAAPHTSGFSPLPPQSLPLLPPMMQQTDSENFAIRPQLLLDEAQAGSNLAAASLQLSLDPRNVDMNLLPDLQQQQRHQLHELQQPPQQQLQTHHHDHHHHRQLQHEQLAARNSQNYSSPSALQQLPASTEPRHSSYGSQASAYVNQDLHTGAEQPRAYQYNLHELQPPPAAPAAAPPSSSTTSMYLVSETAYDEKGLELLALLLQCAEAVSANNIEEANSILPQLTELATPYGSSVQRVVAYFAEGMTSRLFTTCIGSNIWEWESSPAALPAGNIMQRISNHKIVSAVQVFNDICPFVKFSHFTANQAIVEAFEGMSEVHIIDIDIMHGLQWPALFHILALRPGGPPQSVRITGLGTSMELLEATGKRLSDFAQTLGLPFEYIAVADRIGNVDPSALKVRMGRDALAVHWMQHSLYDVTGSDPQTLSLLRRLSPTVITLVEQDLRHEGSFINRFVEALHYYSALFDSLGATHADQSTQRHIVEQQLLSCEIKNILAPGGPARRRSSKSTTTGGFGGGGGRQAEPTTTRFGQWQQELRQAGFKAVSLSGKAATQAALLLGMFPSDGYTLVEQSGTLKLGWKDLCLLTASAWSSCN